MSDLSAEHGGDRPYTIMKNGQTYMAHPSLACPHCPARFFGNSERHPGGGDRYLSHVRTTHPGQPYSHSAEDDVHKIDYYHYFTRQHPHFFVLSDKHTGQILSNMNLDEEGKVQGVETHPKFRRQGLARKLWDYAKSQSDIGIPEPKHSSMRTKEGEEWAKKIGGDLPQRGRLLSARQMQGMIDFSRQ